MYLFSFYGCCNIRLSSHTKTRNFLLLLIPFLNRIAKKIRREVIKVCGVWGEKDHGYLSFFSMISINFAWIFHRLFSSCCSCCFNVVTVFRRGFNLIKQVKVLKPERIGRNWILERMILLMRLRLQARQRVVAVVVVAYTEEDTENTEAFRLP